jgi:hypothetical protein
MRFAILICGAKLPDNGVASELESAFRRLPPLQSRSEPGRHAGVCKATIPVDAGPSVMRVTTATFVSFPAVGWKATARKSDSRVPYSQGIAAQPKA